MIEILLYITVSIGRAADGSKVLYTYPFDRTFHDWKTCLDVADSYQILDNFEEATCRIMEKEALSRAQHLAASWGLARACTGAIICRHPTL